MAEKKCPYCGNPETETKSQVDALGNKITFNLCLMCNKQFDIKTKQSHKILLEEFEGKKVKNIKKIKEKYGEEAAQNKKDCYFDFDYELFLYKKDKDGNTDFNLSKENIERCQKLLDRNPEDSDNLLRILILKIFVGEDYKELASKFLIAWKRKEVSSTFYCIFIWRDGGIDEPYISRLKSFLLWLMDVNPSQFKEEAKEEYVFYCHNMVVGIANLSRFIDSERLLFEDFDFRWDDEYLKYYALAKFYYSEKKWYESFCLFEKLRVYNFLSEVTNEELLGLKNDICHYKDILHAPPTVEDIEKCAYESFSNINLNEIKEKERLQNLLECFYAALWTKENKIEDSKKELESYLKIYSILVGVFNELARGDYEAAFNKWVEWDKSGFKLMGLDIWEMTQGLKNLKEGTGNKEETLRRILSNPFIKDFDIISQIELKLREFVVENLKEFYNDEEEAWHKGIPYQIRIRCGEKKEARYDPKSPKWAYFDFPDYSDIICFKDNWNSIFRKYFIIEPKDASKSKDELTAPLRRMVEIRNTVVHLRRSLVDNERAEVNEAANIVNKIYEKWKNKE